MTEYNIISTIEGNAPKQKNICCFAHYDKDGIIDTYVIHYLKQIKEQLKCEIIFTSTAPTLRNPEDIKELCSQIIHRENEYYDFGSYLYGYSLINPAEYDNILFANDSVYGAFTDISHLPAKMQEFDIWGITDSASKHGEFFKYRIHSYFLWFNKSSFAFLDKFIAQYQYNSDYMKVVTNGEINLSQLAIKDNFNIGTLCPIEKSIATSANQQPLTFEDFKAKYFLKKLAKRKYKKHIKTMFDRYQYNNLFDHWEDLLTKHDCPIIKVKLVRDREFFYLHKMEYDTIIRQKYPEYNMGLIYKHLHRVAYD